ncbi:MAG: hypothetical protein U0T81_12310 [Saprospiraceae bacterium]
MNYFKFLDYLALLKEKLKDRDGAEKLFKESLLRRKGFINGQGRLLPQSA